MKKSFLIFGVLSMLVTTNVLALAVQSQSVTRCTPPCKPKTEVAGDVAIAYCYNPETNTECPQEVFSVDKPSNSAVLGVSSKIKTIEQQSQKKIDVARAAKVGPKAKKVSDTIVTPASAVEKARMGDGGAIAINCPANCTPDCVILGNVVLCECKDSNGNTCKADVVVSDEVKATATK